MKFQVSKFASNEVFTTTIDEIIEAKNEIVTSNDITINSEAPATQIIEMIADIDETPKVESDKEEPVAMTTVKGTHKAIYFVGNLKQFFVNQTIFLVMSYEKDMEYVI